MEKSVLLLSVLVLVCSWTPQGLSAEEDQIPDFCNLPKLPEEGPVCMAYIPQYFFNSTSQKCEEFIYGGCGGNQNRFDSKRKCMETCHPKIVTLVELDTTAEACGYNRHRGHDRSSHHHGSKEVCGLPPESGPCLAYKPRFFYNDTSEQCEIFIYGGCGGNNNRFKSLSSCQAHCRNYPTLNATEVCKMPPETGPCKAYFPQFYYNPESQRCEPFVYGGCGGNKNRFDSVRECLHLCHPGGSDVIIPLIAPYKSDIKPTVICHLPPKTGPCHAYIQRYYFNSTTQRCEKFIYGGCNGNPNNFVSQRECLLQCYPRGNDTIIPLPEEPGAKRTVICHLPPKKGPCPAHIPRYYFNPKEKKCEEFIYGGCGGNQNNFVDLQHCVKKCALL